ncbi:hypothetical protein [Sphingomonas aerophila]|uniref:Uncharacterized protein n=1 Tax=Sphingomonas aerophila TaxID=1344948 RepID=A0A7W9BGJ5_9SPHN|nr:hypothetical protein [Sphingomonas aerophila]MBB5716829.1 hypothetical protein [Sphingomonas aerophila]
MRKALFTALAFSAVFSSSVAAQDQVEQTAWKRYLLELHDHFCGEVTPCTDVHIPTSTIEAEWSGDTVGRLNLHTLADPIPAPGLVQRRTSFNFGSEFQRFADNIDYTPRITSPALQSQVRAARKVYDRETTRFLTLSRNNDGEWKTFNESQAALPRFQQKTRLQWSAQYAPKEYTARQTAAASKQSWDSMVQKTYPGQVGTWLDSAKNPALETAVDSAGQSVDVYPYLVNGNLEDFRRQSREALTGDDWQPERRIAVKASRSTTDFEQKSGGLTLGVEFDNFSLDLSGRRMSFSRHITANNQSMEIGFGRTKTFTVTPGRWFNSGLISEFGQGPFFNKPAKPYFGASGMMPARVHEIIVGYRPTVLVELTAGELSEAQTISAGGGGLKIGPFRIGGSGSKLKYTKVESAGGNLYRLFDDSDRVYIIAMRSLPLQ